MACISCGRGIFGECDCNPATGDKLTEEESELVNAFQESIAPVAKGPGRPQIESREDMKDPSSTGRKRAAQLWPIIPGANCEWQNLANCGGGKYPILGCATGKQQNIHHGPDKTTTNNDRENIHKICANCHNRWHAANDRDHDKDIPHSPRDASYHERVQRLNEEEIARLKKNAV